VSLSTKRCKDCGQVKPLHDFYRAAGTRDGHRNDCKSCNLAAKKRRYDADPAKYIGMVKRWQQANADRVNANHRKNNARPERKRALRDGRTFGISADEFDELLEKQGGGCAVCGKRPERVASLHLDHDHETGGVRGILCLSCNQGIGKFRDDPDLLERAASYLRNGGDSEAVESL
jgi:hypothetical protein